VLDLGTGTGCLLLSLLHEFPMAIGVGLDMTEGAVRTAAANAAALGLARRALFFVGDWATALSGRFDLVVTNPPYIPTKDLGWLPPEVGRYDPVLALDGGEDGLSSYREIVAGLSKLLVRDGLFVAEVGAGQAGAVAEIIRRSGLTVDGIEADLAGIARCVVARADNTTARKKWSECAAVPSRVTEVGGSVS
jgi:release factor glutamine methyltransferase